MLKMTWTGFALGLALVSGCSQSSFINDEEIADQWQSSLVDNGTQLNGVRMNGVRMNGVRMNGVRMNGVRMNGVRMNGVRMNGTSLEGTPEDTSITVSGADLNSATMEGETESGDGVSLKVDQVFWSPTASRYLYNVKYYDEDGNWQWLCGEDTFGNPIAAMPLMKAWYLNTGNEWEDLTRFSLSCVNAALGKCDLWGYKLGNVNRNESYNSEIRSRDLAVLHQTCQRLVRADYCGNGTPHTRNGTSVDVYDAYGIQTPDNLGTQSLEADWRPDGAHCIRHSRWTTADSTVTGGQSDIDYVQATCPSRLASSPSAIYDCNDETKSSFYPENGFTLSQSQRLVIRNRSSAN